MSRPFISVVTPVYNGEKWLADCIESVLSQNYYDYEYHIVNNCSTDRSLAIAQRYAAIDPRIHITDNESFVSAIENYNISFSLVSQEAAYCKPVSADDWIYPNCLARMVELALRHPAAGIVGCYQRSGGTLKWRGVPESVEVLSGREAARMGILEGIHILGNSTSVMYRADLLRRRSNFYPHLHSHADTSACYEALQHCNLAFVHEVLCEERVHEEQWSSAMDSLAAGSVAYLEILLQYGPLYLEAEEFAARQKRVFDEYYRFLGGGVWKLKRRAFWEFHCSRLNQIGCGIEWARVARAAIAEALAEARDPLKAARKMRVAVKGGPSCP